MSTIFNINGGNDDNNDYNDKINLDDLYERKKQDDLSKLSNYKKILARIHHRIKLTSRQKNDNQFCWFVIPEVILGVPKYDQGACIAYVMEKLDENGFSITYTHPNMIFISWKHWVPGYVRSEIKKRTGVAIDGYGNLVNEDKKKDDDNPLSILTKSGIKSKKNDDKASPFKSTSSSVISP